jgi:hypothetical protein
MLPPAIVEIQILSKGSAGFRHVGVGLQIDLLVFDTFPVNREQSIGVLVLEHNDKHEELRGTYERVVARGEVSFMPSQEIRILLCPSIVGKRKSDYTPPYNTRSGPRVSVGHRRSRIHW